MPMKRELKSSRNARPGARGGRRKGKKVMEKKKCRLCRLAPRGEPPFELDYKDVMLLQKLCTSQGKMYSRKRSGNCTKHQQQLRQAMKRARFLAILAPAGLL